jgi:hypothetical protein
MRYFCLGAAALILFTGVSCLEWPIFDSLRLGDQPGDASPARCHSGILKCADGPVVTDCGTWSFDVNAEDAVTGTGEIATGPSSGPVQFTLSGIIDADALVAQVTLTSSNGGDGTMTLSYVGPTLELTGEWSFTDGPEPSGTEVSGEVTGTSCVSLW